MFTEQQIKAAHSKVKTGADFPKYIREIKQLGLVRYEFFVADGSTIYYGDNGHKVSSDARYGQLSIALTSSAEKLKGAIAIHQQGQTDFFTFCKQAAEAGVDKWMIDTKKMLCTYHNIAGEVIVSEPIPDVGY